MASRATEDYLTAVLRLEEANQPPTTGRLARQLGVAPASVTGMLTKLAQQGLVERRPYRSASLTARGRALALSVVRRHRLVETFLVRALGLDPERVHTEAHRWEHALSDDVVGRLDAWLGYPRHDPHGAPIPRSRDGGDTDRRLTLLAAGQEGRVRRIAGADAGHSGYLHELGLEIGVTVAVVERRPYGGPFTLEIDGKRHVVGPEVTDHVLVERKDLL
jgi:DtxR family Mn-dependent transcriptional regulator